MIENRGVVISAEYFTYNEGQAQILNDVLKDRVASEHVTGLWVPHSLLGDHETMQHLTSLSMGKGLDNYRPLEIPSGSKEKPRTFKLVIDTACAGGVRDMVQRVSDVLKCHPGSESVFTVSPDAKSKGIEALLSEFAGESNVSFLLIGVYPEYEGSDIKRFYRIDESGYTRYVSHLASEYGMAGLVGYGGLARCSVRGQYYLAMGVTHDGVDYLSRVNARNTRQQPSEQPAGRYVKKRAITPESALNEATNTEILLGRALLACEGGTYERPPVIEWGSEQAATIVNLVKENLLVLTKRAQSVAAYRAEQEIQE